MEPVNRRQQRLHARTVAAGTTVDYGAPAPENGNGLLADPSSQMLAAPSQQPSHYTAHPDPNPASLQHPPPPVEAGLLVPPALLPLPQSQTVAPSPRRTVVSAVPLTEPVLALRLDCIDGVTEDPYVVKPVLRVHVIDARSGRYFRPSALVSPPPAALAVPGAERRTVVGPVVEAAVESSCFPRGASPASPAAHVAHVVPLSSVPALNSALDADAAALRGARQCRDAAASGGVATSIAASSSPVVLASDDGGGAQVLPIHLGLAAPTLLFNDLLVFDVCVHDSALLPHAVVLFELVDDNPSLPAEARREGNGYYRIAWGFLRLGAVLKPTATDSVPVGMPAELVKAGQQSPADLSALRVTLYRYRGRGASGWAAQLAARLSGFAPPTLAADDGSGIPAPDVAAEFFAPPHLRELAPGGLTLRAVPFAAAVPQVSYLLYCSGVDRDTSRRLSRPASSGAICLLDSRSRNRLHVPGAVGDGASARGRAAARLAPRRRCWGALGRVGAIPTRGLGGPPRARPAGFHGIAANGCVRQCPRQGRCEAAAAAIGAPPSFGARGSRTAAAAA